MKGKLNKTWKVVLSAFILLTSFGITTISATEQFDIRSDITYGEDNKNAVISLDLTSIDDEYTVESIKDPDGNAMDLTDLNYNVLKNGIYDFYVSYFDGTNTKYEYTKTVTVDGVKTVDRSGLTRANADYSDDVTVVDWDILDSNGDPLSTINQVNPGGNYQLKVDWSLATTGGAVLHENDTFTIAALPTNQSNGYWAMSNSDWEVFTDEHDVELGKWRINASKIEVVLNANAEGKQYIEGSFITGKSALYNGTMLGITQNVTIGTIPKSITFKQYQLNPILRSDGKSATMPSNSTIRWLISLNNESIFELTQQPLGQNFTILDDVYLEDTLSGKFDGNFIISYSIAAPVNLTSGAAASIGARELTITSHFTRTYQTAGQSYNDFKSSLNPLEWGVYEDASGVQTVVVYFGDIGDNGLKYSDIDPSFATIAANSCISNGYYAESDRAALIQYFTDVYGDDNVIDGHVVKYIVRIGESYDKVIVDTEKINTAVVTKDGTENALTGKGTLQGISGSVAAVDANKARVWLTDKDTVDFLDGVSMKLQRYDGTNWIDYNGWLGGTISSDGYVDTSAIGDGTYRFIQQAAYSSEYDLPNSDGYDTGLGKVVSDPFTISASDTEGKTVYMTNVKYKYDVIYDPGTQGTFTTITHNDVVINTTTPAYSGAVGSDGKPAGNSGYTFTGWSPALSSTVTEGVTYVAQWSANADTAYKVEHYLEQSDGSYDLEDTDNLTGTTGTTVNAVAKSYPGYTPFPLHTSAVLSGTVLGNGSLTLKLYYRANTNTAYKVEHYLEQSDGSYDLDDTDNLTGTTGHIVTATSKSYSGYTFDNTVAGTVESGTVLGNGSLTLKLYYRANTNTGYKVEHYLEQSDGSYDLDDTDNLTGTTGHIVTATSKSYLGYTFDNTVVGTVESGTILGNGSLTLKLYYRANTDTAYKVEHYLEQTNGTFALEDTDNLTGTTGATVNAVAKTYAGYTVDLLHANAVLSGTVLGDGSLTLKLYYRANTTTAYKVEHYLEQSDGAYSLEDTDNLTGTTGHAVTATAKTYAGYTFDNTVAGTVESGSILGNGSLTLKLYYRANTNTAYKVEHYLEQSDGTYSLENTDNLTGTTGVTVTATAKTYVGYTFDNTIAGTVASGSILGNGSLTLKLYYRANTDTAYKVEHYLEQSDGTYSLEDTDNLAGATGYTVTATAKTYAGYTFDNTVVGTIESGTVLGNGSLTLKLYYRANTDTAYKVEHYLEQPDGTYTLQDTENLIGTTGHTVTTTAKTYAGYKLDTSHTDTVGAGVIAGDGSLVLKLYYVLDDVDYAVEHYLEQSDGTFKLDSSDSFVATAGSSVNATVKTYATHKYDATHALTVDSGIVAHDGSLVLRLYYVLDENPVIAPTEATYKVEYHLEQANGSYALQETDTFTGTIGTTVSANEKVFTGYKLNKSISQTIDNGIVLDDNSLTLRLYYTKQELELTQKPSTAADKDNTAVNTSDNTTVNIYIGLMFLSLMGLLMMLRKHSSKENL